jgi:hypothetical protein
VVRRLYYQCPESTPPASRAPSSHPPACEENRFLRREEATMRRDVASSEITLSKLETQLARLEHDFQVTRQSLRAFTAKRRTHTRRRCPTLPRSITHVAPHLHCETPYTAVVCCFSHTDSLKRNDLQQPSSLMMDSFSSSSCCSPQNLHGCHNWTSTVREQSCCETTSLPQQGRNTV